MGAAAAFGMSFGVPRADAQCEAGWVTHLPTSRTEADAAYDSRRQRVVLFGGIDGAAMKNDTWEYDGSSWRLAASGAGGPAPRRGAKMVFDPLRGRTLLVGGFTGVAGAPIETWAWDGATWRLVNGAGPSFTLTANAAQEAAAAFDQARGRVVLVLANGQTWELNAAGGSWQMITTAAAGGPSARQGTAMAYDRGRGRVRLFGGVAGSTRLADTWEWDGAAWTPVPITGGAAGLPAARSDARMVYDQLSLRVILYGGIAASGARVRDTWALSGTMWTQLSATGPATPAGGAGVAMVADPAHRETLLIGGSVAPWADVCRMSIGAGGAAWAQVEFGPSARSGAAGAYDEGRGRAVVFGGLGSARLGDTWEFDGGGWQQVAVSGSSPSPRNEAAIAYDPVRRRVVLFGGNTGAVSGETWEYDGAAAGGPAWTRVSTTGPSARERHAMVYDPALHGVLLHGGAVSGGANNNQTWLWNGSVWTMVGAGPTRAGHAMAYMPSIGRTVLYGGSGAGVSQTAFAWDGAAWTALGGTGPGPATEATLTFDPESRQLVLVGASGSDAAAWLFDGSAWRRVPNAPGTARARVNHCAWYDAAPGGGDGAGRIMTYGGTTGLVTLRETWEYRGLTGPAVVSVPTWQVSCRTGAASFGVQLAPAAAADSVVWLKNGFTLALGRTPWGSTTATGASSDGKTFTLSITGVADADSGAYQCLLTDACGGRTATNPATLRVCAADFNCSGSASGDGVSEQDIFDFLTAWFAGDPRADVDRSGGVSVEDLFEYLAVYFAGC